MILYIVPFIILFYVILKYRLYIYEKDVEFFEEKKLDLNDMSIPAIKNYVVGTVRGAIKTIRPDEKGPKGDKGEKGDKGDSGGTFTNKGPIRSIANPKMFISRDISIKGKSQLKMDNQNYLPEQSWVYLKDGKISSLYNNKECINISNEGKLEIERCGVSGKWNFLGKTSQLQFMKPVDGYNKCLAYNYSPNKKKGEEYNVRIENCMVKPDQSQSWSFD